MATNTYVALDKVTLTSNASDVTFSSIPSGYTDLVVVVMGASTTAGSSTNGLRWQINGDTSSNYSETQIYGDGSTATSTRSTNATDIGAGLLMQTSAGYFATNIISFMNYSNSTTYKTILTRNGGASVSTAANVALWRSTSAITSIKFYRLTDQLKSGSTFSLYGIKAEPVPTAKATGGTITYSVDGYIYHTFTSSGTFTPNQTLSCDYLVVGGGGGVGGTDANNASGGGGAGGYRTATAQSLSATAYTVTIGAGGSHGTSNYAVGTNGGDSTFNSFTSTGGGRGGTADGGAGGNGGSGGGGGGASGAGGTGNSPSTSPSQGNNGGLGNPNSGSRSGGGGGGATGTGVAGTGNSSGGDGSNSLSTWAIATNTGVNGYYAGGGGGGGQGSDGGGSGGAGGGGAGGAPSSGSGTSGTANTGGGGGGAGDDGNNGGNGGSGIVIIRYAS